MQSLTRARVLTADWLQPDLVKQKVAQVEESSMNWELEEFKEWSVPPHMHIIEFRWFVCRVFAEFGSAFDHVQM